jgi:hypothetical protein
MVRSLRDFPSYEALSPHPAPATSSDTKQFRTLVLWLEEMKIRFAFPPPFLFPLTLLNSRSFYELPQREQLRKVEAATWDQAFSKVLFSHSLPL